MRDKEPSLLGLESKAPPPVRWFSRFMIFAFPDEAARTAAVNTVVRRTMQVVSLVTAALVLYLTSAVSRLEQKQQPERIFVITATPPVDAGADQ